MIEGLPPPLPVSSRTWTFRAAEPDAGDGRRSPDVDLVHAWMHEPHVERWWHEAWPRQKWAEVVHAFRATKHALHTLPVLALSESMGAVAFLQVYRVPLDRVRPFYSYEEHDLGVHIAIGDEAKTNRKLGRSILRDTCLGLFAADPECRRVVAEPDADNVMSVRAFEAAGFRSEYTIELPEKTGLLMAFPRGEADSPLRRPAVSEAAP
ncbi:acetyltransferase [Allokutzneria sp. A3M-2-11 16]|uniref:GNAT family N-acetyltransferase n=1 Tax=Allokutzneria sp. A3M-2-11 16 TaxID=2962043 RepID=UPI0020B6EAB7|nr:GNAT family N-acetyltransferase [Allokutzneria sp. A3M-2-11 16]MCP3801211.1 acetyltransferase [Allokutzneria sp. A3M-2-11 16]